MSDWIEELENNAKKKSKPHVVGTLLGGQNDEDIVVICYLPTYGDAEYINLEGEFTIEQLEALVVHMKKIKKET